MLYQISPAISYGDAVGNEIVAIDGLLRKNGIAAEIRIPRISRRMRLNLRVKKLRENFFPDPGDTILYHVTSGSDLNLKIYEYSCRVILRYHNITPPEFFKGYNDTIMESCEWGRNQLKEMAGKTEYVLADSEYNKSDLISCGFTCPIEVIPILKKPVKTGRISPDPHMILSVGRLAPNKRVDNVIKVFAEYQKNFDPKAYLIIVGSDYALEKCSLELKELCEKIWSEDNKNLTPPTFAGHVSDRRLVWYFRKAGMYITMSEHEGFCVPLIESMEYGIPIVAYNSTAIPGTLGGAGVLLNSPDPVEAAKAMNRIFSDKEYRNEIVEGEAKRLEYFSCERVGEEILRILQGPFL